MKSLINILIITVYLSLSAGFNILVHTCGDYTSVYVMPLSAEDPCNECGSHGCCDKDPCCKLEIKVFHIYDSQLQSQIPKQYNKANFEEIIPTKSQDELLRGHLAPVIPANTSPPEHIPKHILDCTFLI
jgi:hypothetical protein